MCGIIGYVGYAREGQWRQTYDILRALFLASEHRGRDATGFVAMTEPLDSPLMQRTILDKAPIQSSRFIGTSAEFRRLHHQRCSVFLGHVRAATHGSPTDNVNNHPHAGRDGLYLVHNGVVSNHREIADKYALRCQSQCDSEVLLRLIETRKNPALGLDICLREADGSLAVAVLDERNGVVWLARNAGRPLWLARLERDRRWFIASTGTILLESLRRVLGQSGVRLDYFAPIPEDTPVAVSAAGMVVAPLLGPS